MNPLFWIWIFRRMLLYIIKISLQRKIYFIFLPFFFFSITKDLPYIRNNRGNNVDPNAYIFGMLRFRSRCIVNSIRSIGRPPQNLSASSIKKDRSFARTDRHGEWKIKPRNTYNVEEVDVRRGERAKESGSREGEPEAKPKGLKPRDSIKERVKDRRGWLATGEDNGWWIRSG